MIKPLTSLRSNLCTVLSTGCCPDGCFVRHGELYQRLAHPKPCADEFWKKTGVSEDQRSLDWVLAAEPPMATLVRQSDV